MRKIFSGHVYSTKLAETSFKVCVVSRQLCSLTCKSFPISSWCDGSGYVTYFINKLIKKRESDDYLSVPFSENFDNKFGTQSVNLVIVRGSIRKHRETESRENAKGKTLEK